MTGLWSLGGGQLPLESNHFLSAVIWETPKLLGGVFPPASTEPAPLGKSLASSPSPALPSSSQVGPGLQLQWPPEPSPGLILLRYLPGPATSLLRALLTPLLSVDGNTHSAHEPSDTPPPPPTASQSVRILQPCIQGPFTSSMQGPYFFENQKNRVPQVWGRLATCSFSRGQRVGLQQNMSSLWVCRSIYSNR